MKEKKHVAAFTLNVLFPTRRRIVSECLRTTFSARPWTEFSETRVTTDSWHLIHDEVAESRV